MKNLIRLSVLAAAALLLGACSTIESRIQEKSAVFNSLDPVAKDKISHGDIDLGFTPDMVYIALGDPDARRERISSTGSTEEWVYRSYYSDYAGSAFMGYRRWYGHHPYGRGYRVYWRPVHYDVYRDVPEDNIRVTFQQGRVVMIDQVKST